MGHPGFREMVEKCAKVRGGSSERKTKGPQGAEAQFLSRPVTDRLTLAAARQSGPDAKHERVAHFADLALLLLALLLNQLTVTVHSSVPVMAHRGGLRASRKSHKPSKRCKRHRERRAPCP